MGHLVKCFYECISIVKPSLLSWKTPICLTAWRQQIFSYQLWPDARFDGWFYQARVYESFARLHPNKKQTASGILCWNVKHFSGGHLTEWHCPDQHSGSGSGYYVVRTRLGGSESGLWLVPGRYMLHGHKAWQSLEIMASSFIQNYNFTRTHEHAFEGGFGQIPVQMSPRLFAIDFKSSWKIP